jgi:gamma-glutamyltranspeptidase / glutathione hydrolase
MARGGVIAGGHPSVAEAGRAALALGGNAVDAVVGAMLMAFQAEPVLASPGGGGFMVLEVGGQARALDFFSTAPGLGASASPWQPPPGAFWAMDVNFGPTTQTFHVGPGSMAIPGALLGMCEAQRRYGRLPLADVMAPAIRGCYDGTTLTSMNATLLRLLEPIVRSNPAFERLMTHPDGRLLGLGDLYRNPDLGGLFAQVAAAGSARIMYEGPEADALLLAARSEGAGWTAQDLASYQVLEHDPVRVEVGGAQVLLTPPPSSGGMLVAYSLALLEGWPSTPAPGSVEDVLLLRAVMAEVARARADILGAQTPNRDHMRHLLARDHVQGGRARVQALLRLGAGDLKSPPVVDNKVGSTTHVSAIDADGNGCATTISSGECSGFVWPGRGVFMNNFLGEEDLNPCGFHKFLPGARMGSTMTPALVALPDGGKVALGTGGSNRIRAAVMHVIRNLLTHHMTPSAAVQTDRTHYEAGTLYVEATHSAPALAALEAQGMVTKRFDSQVMFFGGVHTAMRSGDGALLGLGDPRRDGASLTWTP